MNMKAPTILRLQSNHQRRHLLFGLLSILLSLQGQLAASIQLDNIDLGPMPVGKATSFELQLPATDESLWLTDVESSCSCMVVERLSETSGAQQQSLHISFTPENTGLAEVHLTFTGLDMQSQEPFLQKIPVTVVGFASPKSVSLPSGIEKISAATLHANLGDYQVIDIRGSSHHQQAHIPGSLEYRLQTLQAVAQQFPATVVLAGDGLLAQREVTLLEKLQTKIPKLFWLEGGLPAWMRSGLPVQGTWPSKVNVSTISLQRWLEVGGADSEGWQVVDLAQQLPDSQTFFGHAVAVYDKAVSAGMKSFLTDLQEASLRKIDSKGILMVGDERHLAYPSVERYLHKQSSVPVYYLNRGYTALSTWLASARDAQLSVPKTFSYSTKRRTLSTPGVAARYTHKRGCSSCPKR